MEDGFVGLRHMLTIVFLNGFAGIMEAPVITDVTVAAVCSGPGDSCSLAVYLTGFQQVAIGLGTMVMLPVIGNLSDRYGTKAILTLPMCLSILPPVILGYRRDTQFFYLFYVIKILTALVCEGAVDCLAFAYVAENIHDGTRISAFSILAGIKTISALCGTLVARFLPISLIFKYFLKARFGFDKNQFADLIMLITIAGSISQLFVLPRFASTFGDRKLLSTGLFMEFIYMAIFSISWAPWVPYLITVFIPGAIIVMPSGKVQGCISGVRSVGKVVAPFVFSPLTALFLSNDAPFFFPGFSILCISLPSMIGFLLSLMIKDVPVPPLNKAINNSSSEEM
ncbi:unnamed protein product [Thlaspi arvense]|uniref:Major facilitator superfamily protein n=1 Tax=Thlaspi arvense TaxID=13288 RepID=A0AAU9RY99_THLAR|nr:unnamed protein product [Thlaspi arvense]